MNGKRIAVGLVVVGVLATVATATGASGSSCPERAGQACQYGGDESSSSRSDGPTQQRPRLKPSVSVDRHGQPVWRAGNGVMY